MSFAEGLAAFDDVSFESGSLYTFSEWYDVDYAGYMAEDGFYRMLVTQQAANDGLLVEYGAGTGRLCLGYLGEGARVHAVEPCAEMLERLLEKARAMDLAPGRLSAENTTADAFVDVKDGAADLVTFPFNGLLHITSHEELRAVLRRSYCALRKGGVFAIDITTPSWDAMSRGLTPWGRVDERVHPRTGEKVLTCDSSRYDPASRILTTDFRFLVEGEPQGMELRIEQFMWATQEIRTLVEEEGFSSQFLFGDVDFSPFKESSSRMLLSALKA
ncbi:MAG: class I SAM-dependent methyltransferase [Deltaproteobacteria bacterium]|nr:class I SAM-dependent methyltransferase [Deltaproteobacteria bacterium]